MTTQIEREDSAVFTFDGTLRCDTPVRATLTQSPLETGSSVTDHVQRLPDQYTLVCIHTTTPSSDDGGPIGDARLAACRSFLSGCIGSICELTIPRVGVLRQMLLGSYSTSYDARGRLEVTMQWQQAEFATAEEVTIPAPVASVEPQMSDEQDAGTQSPESVDATEGEQSILSYLIGA